MIIQINATVCAAADHGDGAWRKIAGRDRWRRAQNGREGAVAREDRKFKK